MLTGVITAICLYFLSFTFVSRSITADAETYAVVLIVALLIGVVTAIWAFRRAKPTVVAAPPPPVVERATSPAPAVAIPVAPDIAPFAPGVDTAIAEALVETAPEHPLPPPPVADGPADDLQTLKGVGAKLAARLNELGITRFAQLTALTRQPLTGRGG